MTMARPLLLRTTLNRVDTPGSCPLHSPVQQGLTLLELLVAFSIMAMSLGVLYKSMGGSARQAGELSRRQEAALIAQAVLAMRDSVTAQGWQERGTSGVYTWTVTSQPYRESGDSVPALHQVNVQVQWADGASGRQLTSHTLLPQRMAGPAEVVQ
jgi:general secretion pathway protein I